MGATAWSDAHYHSRAKRLLRAGRSAFGYDEDIRAQRVAAGVHAKMDPAKLKNGRRESRDSHLHADSTAVAVFFDVTGSMQRVPRILQKKLCTLFDLLLRREYLEDPAILVGGIALHGFCFGCFIFVAFIIVDEETTKDVRASAQSLFNLVVVGLGIIVGSYLAADVAPDECGADLGFVGDSSWRGSRQKAEAGAGSTDLSQEQAAGARCHSWNEDSRHRQYVWFGRSADTAVPRRCPSRTGAKRQYPRQYDGLQRTGPHQKPE